MPEMNDRTKRSAEVALELGHAVSEIREIIRRGPDGVHVEDIHLGTPNEPRLSTSIDRDPRQTAETLARLADALERLVAVTDRSVKASEAVGHELGIVDVRLSQRIAAHRAFGDGLRERLRTGGPPWHPARLAAVLQLIEEHCKPGRPEIEVQVTVTYLV